MNANAMSAIAPIAPMTPPAIAPALDEELSAGTTAAASDEVAAGAVSTLDEAVSSDLSVADASVSVSDDELDPDDCDELLLLLTAVVVRRVEVRVGVMVDMVLVFWPT